MGYRTSESLRSGLHILAHGYFHGELTINSMLRHSFHTDPH
jgi:hypothetical protein